MSHQLRVGLPLDPLVALPLDLRVGLPLDLRVGLPLDLRVGLPVELRGTKAWLLQIRQGLLVWVLVTRSLDDDISASTNGIFRVVRREHQSFRACRMAPGIPRGPINTHIWPIGLHLYVCGHACGRLRTGLRKHCTSVSIKVLERLTIPGGCRGLCCGANLQYLYKSRSKSGVHWKLCPTIVVSLCT